LAALRVAEIESSNSYALELAELNLQIAELELQKLQWDPNTAREEIAVAERKVEIAQADVDSAKAGNSGEIEGNITMAQVELELADLALTRAERELARLQLRAPVSGTIRIGQMRIGTPVKAYETVARIVDPESLVVESNLVSDDQALLMEGMPVEMEVNYLRGVTFPGEITRLPQPYGSGMTPLTQIQPDLTNSNLSLREGAAVTVRAVVGRAEDVLWLPNSAVQTVGGKSYVVVREGDVLADREITTGLVGDERTEVVSGLSEGIQVVGR
jgi:RND family efflux transporter MFP subunit